MGRNKGKKKATGMFILSCVVFASLADGMVHTEQVSDAEDADSDDDFQKLIIIRKRKAKATITSSSYEPTTRKRMMTAKDTADADNDDDFRLRHPPPKVIYSTYSKYQPTRAHVSIYSLAITPNKQTVQSKGKFIRTKLPNTDINQSIDKKKRKNKNEIKFEKADKRRKEKYEAKEENRKANNKLDDDLPIYSTYQRYQDIIANTCKYPEFVRVLQKAVLHATDVTYAGALFANYYFLPLLNEQKPLPFIDHELVYSLFSVVTGQGTKVPDHVKKAFEKFQDQIPSFDKELQITRIQDFDIAGGKTVRREYKESRRSKLPEKDSQRRKIAERVYEGCTSADTTPTFDSIELTKVQLNKVEAVAKDLQKEIGVEDLSESALSARPHLYLPWLHKVLQRMEQTVFIRDDQPEETASKAFIHRNLQEVRKILSNHTNLSKLLFSSLKVQIHNAINLHKPLVLPKSFTAPLPEPIMKDIKTFIEETSTELKNGRFAFSKLLLDSGLRTKKDGQVTQETAKQEYFRIFDMAKIGCKALESLETDKRVFWNQIITDRYDLMFVFKKPKEEYQPQDPDSIRKIIDDPDTIVWSVDPGVIDIITSVDGVVDEPHRIRQTSAKEYYYLCGYNRAMDKRNKYMQQSPDTKELVDAIPSVKTASLQSLVESIEYRMNHYHNICEFYHRKFRYNKLKFKSYVNKQKGLAEIAKRLLGGSDKYRPDREVTSHSLDFTRQNQGCHAESPWDTATEKEKPVVVAFGDGSFSGSMKGKITAPTKSVFHALKQYALQRKAPTFILKTDEYLSSQICPKCHTRSLQNLQDKTNSKIHAVLRCKTCSTVWNRDVVTALNIRRILIHMAKSKSEKPAEFKRESK
ncbi:hypothetical protein VTP01DRAFT_6032 [Rhizomucor pusillus]|uniref:uncharacterized protein n=1 Tax=Rhizomucor pusillus TaxID=4840 RepID=UPI003742C05A